MGCAWSAIRLLEGVGKSVGAWEGREAKESGEKEINKYIIVFGICFTLYFLCFCVRTPWYPTVFSYWGLSGSVACLMEQTRKRREKEKTVWCV